LANEGGGEESVFNIKGISVAGHQLSDPCRGTGLCPQEDGHQGAFSKRGLELIEQSLREARGGKRGLHRRRWQS